jgi:YtkA-like protein
VRVRTGMGPSQPDVVPFRRAGLLALGVSLGLLLGCSRSADPRPDIEVSVELSPQPPSTGPSRIGVALAGSDGRPLGGAVVALEANMTHPGMSPVLARAAETAPGRYEAVIDLTMAGDWVFTIDARLADGTMLRREVSVPAVRAR